MAGSWGLNGRKGAVVAGLVPAGPAARGGAEPGDVVVSVNGHEVGSASELTREVAKVHAGDSLRLEVYRNGKPKTVTIIAGLRPSEEQLAKNGGAGGEDDSDSTPGGAPSSGQAHVLGMAVTPIDPESRQQYNIAAAVKGVLVQSVKSTSDAGDKGLKRGDVIVRAGDREVASAGDITAAVGDWKKAGRTSIPLEVTRGGVSLFVPIKIEG
jgi:serine protease Do